MGHPFAFRRRLKATRNEDGRLVVVIPPELTELMGITEDGADLHWKLNNDGSALLKALR